MKTLIISKEMKERQKYFPWLKIFVKELFKKFPQYDNSLKYLSENVEKEIAALSDNDDDKIKIEALFETINSLFLHFWWKIHWAENCQWKKYWKIDAPYSYCCNELTKYAGKLLYFLIYLGIILSEGVSNSIWINRILQAINVFPSTDDVVYSSLFQIPKLKKKQHPVYMNILKHVLCTKVPLHINEPTVYLKSMMLYKRLINFIEDAAAKATVTSIAANIKPPPDIIPYLSSLKIYLKSNENILNQLFKKKYFKKIKNVFLDAEPNNKNDNLSEILENKREKKKIKIDNDNEKDKSFLTNFDPQNVLDDVNKRSEKSECSKMSKSKSNKNGDETLVNKDTDFVELSCTNEVDFFDIKSQMKDISNIKPTSKKEKCLKEKDIFFTSEKKIKKCKVKQNIRNLKKAKCKTFNAVELGESTCINNLPSLITNYNSSEERDIKSRSSPLEASDTSNIREQQIPDKLSKQCTSIETKTIETVSVKSNYQDDYSGNLTPELYNPILGDINNSEIHAVSNQATDNCSIHDLNMSKEINDNINTMQDTNTEICFDEDGNNSVMSNLYKNYLQNNRKKIKISPRKQAQKRAASQALEYVNESSSIDGSKTSKQVKKQKKRKSKRNVTSFDGDMNAEKALNSSDPYVEVSNTEVNEIIHLNESSDCGDCFSKENEFIDSSVSCKNLSICNSKLKSCTILQQNKESQKLVSSDESSVTDKTFDGDMNAEKALNLSDPYVEVSNTEANEIIRLNESSDCGDYFSKENEFIDNSVSCKNLSVCNSKLKSCTILQQNKESQKFVSSDEQLKHKSKSLKTYLTDECSVTDNTTSSKQFKKWNFKLNLDPSTGDYLDIEIVSEISNLNIEISGEERNEVSFDSSSHLLSNHGDSAIQEKEPIQKNVFHTQNAVSNKMTSSKSSVCHETSEVSAHEAGEESGIFDLSFDKENEQKCNEVPHVLIQDNKNSQSNLFDVSDQNLLPNFGSDLFSESNSFQGVHPFSKIDQQKELLPKDVDYFEERNMRLNSLEVKKNPFLLRKDSHRNKITMNPIFSSAYESTPKDSSNGTCQNHSARNLQFLTTGNINESSSNDFVSSSDLSIGNQFRTPKSVRHNKNTQKTKGIPKDKIKKKEKKLAEMNLKQIGFYRNAKIYTDSSDDILCSSDKEFDDVFKAISNTDTSPSLFPTQKSNVSTFKDCKRKLIASVPRLHLPENCKSNHRDDASNLAETSDESNKLPARSVFEQKSQPRMNDTLEKSMNHTYSLRKRRRSSIERRKLYVV
ncbi:uncharacterized protein TNIN_349751 [Trichonephila inaurata madagascariensis]|uniref:Uncharacterized protein n=1 Tax=Trichonephila inaurata madagascariensis TaxID=2747483 RepID=A0A8X6WNS1_9ARAC|nr:uncharacterized protein TNIN_349751 [Trichonephila inaurata madagascariensis]